MRPITFLGGPLDGRTWPVECGEVGDHIIVPMLSRMPGVEAEVASDRPLFRRGIYVLRWVRDDFVGAWEGESEG